MQRNLLLRILPYSAPFGRRPAGSPCRPHTIRGSNVHPVGAWRHCQAQKKGEQMHTHVTKRGLLAVAALLLALAGAGALARWQLAAQSPGVAPGRNAGAPGGDLDAIAQLGYLPDPGGVKGGEGDELLRLDAYWQTRVTYPTGRFDFRWLRNAAQQDRTQVRAAVPAG